MAPGLAFIKDRVILVSIGGTDQRQQIIFAVVLPGCPLLTGDSDDPVLVAELFDPATHFHKRILILNRAVNANDAHRQHGVCSAFCNDT